MTRRTLLLVAVLALVGACGGGGSETADATTSTVATTTSTVAKGTYRTPQDAANNLMLAWKNSDGEAAQRSATQDAVLALFARTYTPHSPRGCDTPSQLGSDCNFRLSGTGDVRLHATGDPEVGFIIDKVTFLDA